MTKSAAQKIVEKISDNRREALLKLAYEAGARNHALFSGVDAKTSEVIAKKASAYMDHMLKSSELRRSALKDAILRRLGK